MLMLDVTAPTAPVIVLPAREDLKICSVYEKKQFAH